MLDIRRTSQAADVDALEGVDVASAFLTLDFRSTLADVCF
jgi:hypothetical protein